ncbi:MAG: TonB-dependent receptor [Proteobacteria bacterium]|nr:TonB-dependent receptor [Pseudomonadota bacterium]
MSSSNLRLSKLSLGLFAALAVAPVFAQSTGAGIAGRITTGNGQPVAGAEVTITHVESGTNSRAVTDANGRYNATGLRPGGPYTVKVHSSAGDKSQSGVFLTLNNVSQVDETVGASASDLGMVTVTGRANADLFNSDKKGLGTNIAGRKLETTPSGNRSIDDIARLDPRITVTDQNDGSISVAGQNNRYNNITVDGLSQNDPFGLNANGLPYTSSPISPDTIAAYNISTTDFDAGSDTVGANINAVTKSGTNQFHGSVYYAFKNANSMVGRLGGPAYTGFDKDKTFGVTFGGPIIKDRLFFFASYENQKVTGISGVGSDAVTTGKLTTQQVNDVANAFQQIGIQAGTYGNAAATLEDKRYLAKLDWNINDKHRAALTFQRTEENLPSPYSSYVKDTSVILPSNWYTTVSKTDNYSLQLFSDWSDNFSTEAKIGYQKFSSVAGAAVNQPEVFACFTAVASQCANYAPNSSANWVIAGEDRYRHANWITSKRINATFSGTYHAGDHVIKGGFDYLSNEVADLFGSLLNGSYGFYDKNGNGSVVDEILSKNYATFVKNYLPAGVTQDQMAGSWKYTQISPFIQDTWQATDRLSLTFGVRVDLPKANHAPPVAVEGVSGTPAVPAAGTTAGAPVWETRFGYPSNTTLGSKNKVIEPRFAFNYQFDTKRPTQLRGGIGLFQSTPPYVWLTNPYVNNGVVGSKGYRGTNPVADPFNPDPNNQPGPNTAVAGTCAANANCQIDVLDPNFKMPTVWKTTLAFDTVLPIFDIVASIEYQHLKNKNAIAYVAPNLGVAKGTLPDGRLSYWTTYPNASPTQIGNGQNNGSFPEIYYRSTLLTNTNKGKSDAITVALSKTMAYGLSANFSATFTHATEVNPGTSAQAWSNYNYVAYANPNQFDVADARLQVRRSFKLGLNWDHAFFGNYKTTISAFYNGRTGQPYSWTFGNDVNGDNIANVDLAYIPLLNDPKVNYGTATAAQIAAFQNFIDSDPYLHTHRGQIAGRNTTSQPWINQLDVGIQQEFPGFFKGHKSVVRLDIYNFLNMLNKKWGEQNTIGWFGTRRLVNVSDVANGQYVYNLGTPTSPTWQSMGIYDSYKNPSRVVSRWSVLATLKYQF